MNLQVLDSVMLVRGFPYTNLVKYSTAKMMNLIFDFPPDNGQNEINIPWEPRIAIGYQLLFELSRY